MGPGLVGRRQRAGIPYPVQREHRGGRRDVGAGRGLGNPVVVGLAAGRVGDRRIVAATGQTRLHAVDLRVHVLGQPRDLGNQRFQILRVVGARHRQEQAQANRAHKQQPGQQAAAA